MGSVQQWLYINLQKWTPFSVLVVVAGIAMIGIIVFDVITGTAIQPSVIAILSILVGSSGTATLVNHGVNVANGVAASTAKEVVKQAGLVPTTTAQTEPPPPVSPVDKGVVNP